MSSRDRRETAPSATSLPAAKLTLAAPANDQPAVSNYPPKIRFADEALPSSHRPTSA